MADEEWRRAVDVAAVAVAAEAILTIAVAFVGRRRRRLCRPM